MLPRFKQY